MPCYFSVRGAPAGVSCGVKPASGASLGASGHVWKSVWLVCDWNNVCCNLTQKVSWLNSGCVASNGEFMATPFFSLLVFKRTGVLIRTHRWHHCEEILYVSMGGAEDMSSNFLYANSLRCIFVLIQIWSSTDSENHSLVANFNSSDTAHLLQIISKTLGTCWLYF